MLNKFIFSVIGLCLVALAYDGQSQQLSYDLNSKSTLMLINQTNDSVALRLRSFTIWPYKDNKLKRSLAAKDKLKLELDNQGRNYAYLLLDNETYNIFIQPGSVDTITISSSGKDQVIAFSGHSKLINEFQLKKSAYFHSTNIAFAGRSQSYLDNFNSYEEITQTNDSITKINLDYLLKNASTIPKWYMDFEKTRMRCIEGKFKITGSLYRKLFQNLKDPVPANYLENVTKNINIYDEEMLGNGEYMWFIYDLFTFKTHYPFKVEQIDKKKLRKERVELMNNELTGIIKDGCLASEFCGFIDSKSLHDSTWIDLVEEKEFHEFLEVYSVNYSILPEGSYLPYFYLPDTSSTFYEPRDFKGNVLLINFWNAGCKPCIMDFPHENELVKRYKKEPVTILNISTSSRLWKKMIAKHELQTVNLLAEGKWGEKLWNEFDINGLPHSALIDWNGKIIQNKCPRASSNIDELIDGLLIQMKRAHD